MERNTLVISSFPYCGRTTMLKDPDFIKEYKMLDAVSIAEFTCKKDPENRVVLEKNPDFPENYINHIKENLGKYDIIFVCSYIDKKLFVDADIPFITVYPEEILVGTWIQRMKDHNDTNSNIQFLFKNWDSWMMKIREEPEGLGRYRLGPTEYISDLFKSKKIQL